jgi:hypothetical protein
MNSSMGSVGYGLVSSAEDRRRSNQPHPDEVAPLARDWKGRRGGSWSTLWSTPHQKAPDMIQEKVGLTRASRKGRRHITPFVADSAP